MRCPRAPRGHDGALSAGIRRLSTSVMTVRVRKKSSLLIMLAVAAAAAVQGATAAGDHHQNPPPLLRAVTSDDVGGGFGPHSNGSVVIGRQQAAPLNITGLEGSFFTRTSDGIYHFLSGGEMRAPKGMNYPETDIHMRFDHWQSHDGVSNWSWTAKIYESSGVFDGTDRRGSTWAPMAAFDRASEVWHLFYVVSVISDHHNLFLKQCWVGRRELRCGAVMCYTQAYRASPAYRTPLGLYRDPRTHKPQALHAYTQFDGEIYHAKSTVKGEHGIAGPYEDVGPVLNQEDLGGFDPNVDTWEGDHGCDMFFPFQLDDGSWLALYGSEMGRFPHFSVRWGSRASCRRPSPRRRASC
eukprot:COSAG01_NODE_3971_length_5480_cov_21.700242_3_plen_353_part_00